MNKEKAIEIEEDIKEKVAIWGREVLAVLWGLEDLKALNNKCLRVSALDELEHNAWKVNGVFRVVRERSSDLHEFKDMLYIILEDRSVINIYSKESTYVHDSLRINRKE